MTTQFKAFFLHIASIALTCLVSGEHALANSLQDNQGYVAYQRGDFERALKIFKSKAAKGDLASAGMLGVMYFHGNGVTRNMQLADQWTKQAADSGNSIAQYIQALLASSTSGNKAPDYTRSYKLMRLAAEQGHIGAQVALGAHYFQGLGVSQDNSLGFYWSQKAALQGDSHGQDNLARAYLEGVGVQADIGKAIYWYQESGKQGYAKAINALGVIYAKGQGVAKNPVLAYAYFDIAGKLDLEAARMNQAVLHQQLSEAQLGMARKLSVAWKPGVALPK